MVHGVDDGSMRLVVAEVAESPAWPARVSELVARATTSGDRLLLLLPPRLTADCRRLLGAIDGSVEVLARDSEGLGHWLRSRRLAQLAWLPADADYVAPDWELLRARPRRLVAWLPKYDLPRDRYCDRPLSGQIGWLGTGDLLDVFELQSPLGASFLSLADRIHRQRLGVEIASTRVADDASDPPAGAAPSLHEGSRVLAIVPHFRCEQWLATALASLTAQTRPADAIVVIDDGSPHPPAGIVEQFPGCTLLVAEGNCGPYRLVQQVIAETDYDGYLFQDADDWSAHDRLELLLQAAARTGADLIGCQEGRWQPGETSLCCLLPDDASRALTAAPVHVLLHPTSLMSRAFLLRAGGFATGLRFFGDTEFLWRSHHWGRIANIPFVSYFRQQRADSLTGSPDTGHRSEARLRIKTDCYQRFWDARAAVERGESPPRDPYRTAPPVALRHVAGPGL